VPGGSEQEERLVRYLLAELSDEDRDQLEAECLGNSELHNELVAVEDELIYAYVGGRLSPSQISSFEQSFLQTPWRRARPLSPFGSPGPEVVVAPRSPYRARRTASSTNRWLALPHAAWNRSP
jgi:hypothetical protein